MLQQIFIFYYENFQNKKPKCQTGKLKLNELLDAHSWAKTVKVIR
jgi:hypothetical protein